MSGRMSVIGCMSGTSLDGLDIALVDFELKNNIIGYNIVHAKTYSYNEIWFDRLKNAMHLSGFDLSLLDVEYGIWIGEQIKEFTDEFFIDLKSVSAIASHGHTVFHRPELKVSTQIGSGNAIHSIIKRPVVFDFRSLDVTLGGQGAPLVPIGDRLLFSEYDYCLNLGGFANLSYEFNNRRMAFDICPLNIVLNALSQKHGFTFDRNGELGRASTINIPLLDQLNTLQFYKKEAPKSLGKEWVDLNINPLISDIEENLSTITTFYEHCAFQIGKILKNTSSKTLVTGGGAYNSFLMERIKYYAESEIVIAENIIVEFKEALIFALLAYLKLNNRINTLASVTGACCDSIGGISVGL
ncbi:MAG: anhydro-N-acetylmuramic acid kinase [Bacteroidales bacterium]|nr:anhydro-N-acetylmuramic acid kinase [Bacteroidales bacterium]